MLEPCASCKKSSCLKALNLFNHYTQGNTFAIVLFLLPSSKIQPLISLVFVQVRFKTQYMLFVRNHDDAINSSKNVHNTQLFISNTLQNTLENR